MKKYIAFCLCISLLPLVVVCQFRYGVTAGGLQSHTSIKQESAEYAYMDIILVSDYFGWTNQVGYSSRTFISGKTRPNTSYYGGFVFDYFLSQGFAIRWKLLLENKGWNEDFKKSGVWNSDYPVLSSRYDSVGGSERFSLHYITIPVNLVFFASLKKAQLYFGAGGYIAYGAVGHYTASIAYSSFNSVKDSVAEISFNTNTDRYKAPYHAHKIDIGLSVSAGIEFRNGLFIDLSYTNGVKDVMIDKYGFEDVTTRKYSLVLPNRLRTFNAGIGYFISKRKK